MSASHLTIYVQMHQDLAAAGKKAELDHPQDLVHQDRYTGDTLLP